MAKTTTPFLCTECGDTFTKWLGKCPSCQSWNTLKEFREAKIKTVKGGKVSSGQDLLSVQNEPLSTAKATVERFSSGIDEVDRVLGGGFFPGSFLLFGGSPGIGKSTLALQILLKVEDALYFSGEESVDQVLHRGARLHGAETAPSRLRQCVLSTNSLENIVETIQRHRPPLAIVDSIQMVGLEDASLGPLAQLRTNAEVLLRLAKTSGTTILVIGHVTKADEIAGPKTLEHMVDAVLQLEGERNSEVRILRSPKNRFGSTLEVGVFEMQSKGLIELKNPSEFFLAERAENATGSAITVVREGNRNFLMEIQALTVKTNFGQPRRTAHGVALSKFHLLLAVVSKFTPFKCDSFDAYLNVVSGLRVQEPAADLAIVAAILSSRAEKEIPADTVIMGEVGLSGEIRSVANIEARLSEAAKLGFKKAIVPRMRTKVKELKSLKVVEVRSVLELMKEVLQEKSE